MDRLGVPEAGQILFGSSCDYNLLWHQEGGPFFDFNRNKSGFAPDVQLGYMVPFAGGNWLAGLKFTYKFANIDSNENVTIPQTWSGTILVPPPPTNTSLTGFVRGLADINLKHQLTLLGTIGCAFGNVALYPGGGPAVFDVNTNFYGVPFAELPICCRFPPACRSLYSMTNGWGAARRSLA
jgi:hypothetical protein